MGKPKLSVSTYVSSYGDSVASDNKYEKEEKARLRKEVAYIEKQLKNWDNEKAGKFLKDQLEKELKEKRERLKKKTETPKEPPRLSMA